MTGLSLDALTVPELVSLLAELETDRRRQPTVEHRLIQTLRNRAEPDNRLIEKGGWTTRKRKDGRTRGFRHCT